VNDSPSAILHVEARTHGRVLIRTPRVPPPWPLLVGFHGYAETAEAHLAAIERVAHVDEWLVAAVQALHPFYTRQQAVVANWMTSQDRELAIADNVDYVGRILARLRNEHAVDGPLVFAGFSQGGAMAYRAAARYACSGLIILAADVPPDVAQLSNVTLPPVLIGRGTRDQWYTSDKHAADVKTLARFGVPVESCVFDGGHEWGDEFLVAASSFLRATKNTKDGLRHKGHEGHEKGST
jgi:predicted esterase